MEDYAAKNKVPILLPSSASFLKVILSVLKPKTVLEVGTGIGYSTLTILDSVPKAKVLTVDLNEDRIKRAEEFVKRAGFNVTFLKGDGLDVIRELLAEGKSFDFIFVDSAKGEYPFFNFKVQALLNRGGVAIFDNVLFRGYVCGKPFEKRYKRGVSLLKQFLSSVKHYPNFEATLLPIGDGMLILKEKG